jgi:hypothetical protein
MYACEDAKGFLGQEERRRHVVTLAYEAVHKWKKTMSVADDDAERATAHRCQRARLAALTREVVGLAAEGKAAADEAERVSLAEKSARCQGEIARLEPELHVEDARRRQELTHADEAMCLWREAVREAKKVVRYNIEGTPCRYKKGSCCEVCSTHFLPDSSKCRKCMKVSYCSKACQKIDWNLGHREVHRRSSQEEERLLQESKAAKEAVEAAIRGGFSSYEAGLQLQDKEGKEASSSMTG